MATAAEHAQTARKLAGHASDVGHAAIVEAVLAGAEGIREAVAVALADVWDEGYHAGHEDARAVQPTYPDPTPNPYHPEKP